MPRAFTITPELTYINVRAPSTQYESSVTAQVQGNDVADRTTRGLMYPKDADANLFKRLKAVHFVRAVMVTTSSDSVGGLFTIDAYPLIYNSYQIKAPTWNQAGPGLLWIGGSWHQAARKPTDVADGAAVTHTYNLTRVATYAAAKAGDWPPAFLFKWSFEGGQFGVPLTTYNSDNATIVANRPVLKLVLGIRPMRTRPSGMYRGFRRT
jgi:hypothetical protein